MSEGLSSNKYYKNKTLINKISKIDANYYDFLFNNKIKSNEKERLSHYEKINNTYVLNSGKTRDMDFIKILCNLLIFWGYLVIHLREYNINFCFEVTFLELRKFVYNIINRYFYWIEDFNKDELYNFSWEGILQSIKEYDESKITAIKFSSFTFYNIINSIEKNINYTINDDENLYKYNIKNEYDIIDSISKSDFENIVIPKFSYNEKHQEKIKICFEAVGDNYNLKKNITDLNREFIINNFFKKYLYNYLKYRRSSELDENYRNRQCEEDKIANHYYQFIIDELIIVLNNFKDGIIHKYDTGKAFLEAEVFELYVFDNIEKDIICNILGITFFDYQNIKNRIMNKIKYLSIKFIPYGYYNNYVIPEVKKHGYNIEKYYSYNSENNFYWLNEDYYINDKKIIDKIFKEINIDTLSLKRLGDLLKNNQDIKEDILKKYQRITKDNTGVYSEKN